jgi:transcriptional regulator with XRE-family HTH domain
MLTILLLTIVLSRSTIDLLRQGGQYVKNGGNQETLGSYIRREREARGISANELARQINKDPSYITRLERGERVNPSAGVLQGIADAIPTIDLYKLLDFVGVRPTALLRSYFRRTYGEDADESEVVARLREYQEKTRKEENDETTHQKGG